MDGIMTVFARSRGMRRCATLLLLLTLTACAAPVEQVKVFHKSVSDFRGTSDILIDELNEAIKLQAREKPRNPRTFRPGDADYFADGTDAGTAASYRKGMDALEAYAALLLSLVDGSSAQAVTSQMVQLSQIVASASQASHIGVATVALSPVIAHGTQFYMTQQAREFVAASGDGVLQLLAVMRTQTPRLYQDLYVFEKRTRPAGEVEVSVRKRVSEFVVALNRMEAMVATIRFTFAQGGDLSLSTIVSLAAALQNDLKALRKAMASPK